MLLGSPRIAERENGGWTVEPRWNPHRNRLGAFSAARRQGPPCPPRRSARSSRRSARSNAVRVACSTSFNHHRSKIVVAPMIKSPTVSTTANRPLSLRCGVDSGTPVSSRSVGQGGTSAGLGSLVQPCHTLFNLPPSRRCPMLITRSPSRLALRFLIMSQRVTAHPMTATLIGRIP
jgi:hypothetical protein